MEIGESLSDFSGFFSVCMLYGASNFHKIARCLFWAFPHWFSLQWMMLMRLHFLKAFWSHVSIFCPVSTIVCLLNRNATRRLSTFCINHQYRGSDCSSSLNCYNDFYSRRPRSSPAPHLVANISGYTASPIRLNIAFECKGNIGTKQEVKKNTSVTFEHPVATVGRLSSMQLGPRVHNNKFFIHCLKATCIHEKK